MHGIRNSSTTGRGRLGQVVLLLALIASVSLFGSALATPPSGVITAEVARGALDPHKVNKRFGNGATLKIETTGALEFATQKITAEPGASFGWHTHPGPNINVVQQGTLTFYHDEMCTEGQGIAYGPGSTFRSLPRHIHIARNEGTETVVFFASYFVARTDPPKELRIDKPSPGDECVQ